MKVAELIEIMYTEMQCYDFETFSLEPMLDKLGVFSVPKLNVSSFQFRLKIANHSTNDNYRILVRVFEDPFGWCAQILCEHIKFPTEMPESIRLFMSDIATTSMWKCIKDIEWYVNNKLYEICIW